MLSTEITDDSIVLIGERRLAERHIVVRLPFQECSDTVVEITKQAPLQSVWIYQGSIT